MTANRRASAVLFGFDFQVNAAIILLLENISELNCVRLESNYEDIDITLNNNHHILAQAKAVEKSSTDFRNVRKNLEKALHSLSEGSEKIKTNKLILITNSPNPLNEENSKSIFYGDAHRSYGSLPDSSKKIINSYLNNVPCPLDLNQFSIQILPFETDDENERYKVVTQKINDFIGELKLKDPGLGKQLFKIWKDNIFTNGSKKDVSIVLSKKDLIWPIIVVTTDLEKIGNDFEEICEEVDYDEIVRQYKSFIDTCCEQVEIFTKIVYDFNIYKVPNSEKGIKKKMGYFLKNQWKNYVSIFTNDNMDADTSKGLIQAIIYSILKRRYEIDRIKNGVNL